MGPRDSLQLCPPLPTLATLVSTVSTMASVMLRPRPSPTMVFMVPMASHMPTAMESQLSTMASAMLMLRPSPTTVSMELIVSQLSPPTDTHLSTTMASARLRLNPSGGPATSQLTALPHTILMATTCPTKLSKLIGCAEL